MTDEEGSQKPIICSPGCVCPADEIRKTAPETLLKREDMMCLVRSLRSITVYSSAWDLSGVRILTGSVRSYHRSDSAGG